MLKVLGQSLCHVVIADSQKEREGNATQMLKNNEYLSLINQLIFVYLSAVLIIFLHVFVHISLVIFRIIF